MNISLGTVKKALYGCISLVVALICVLLTVHAVKNKTDEPQPQAESETFAATQTEPLTLQDMQLESQTQMQTETMTAKQENLPKSATTEKPSDKAGKESVSVVVQPVAPSAPAPKPSAPVEKKPTLYQLSLSCGNGISSVSGSGYYPAGASVTVSCTVKSNYTFRGWTTGGFFVPDESKSRVYTFTMPASDYSLIAEAASDYNKVSVSSSTGIDSVSGGGEYLPGDRVTIRCTVKSGYTFSLWDSNNSDVNDGTTQTYSFIMPDSSVTLTAKAEKAFYEVKVKSNSGIASVSGAGTFRPGEKVTVDCSVQSGYSFKKWTSSTVGVNDSNSQKYTFLMPKKDVTLTANAVQSEYKVTLVKGEGILSVSGSGSYAPGTSVTVKCTLKDGYAFHSWASNDSSLLKSGVSQTYTFTMPEGDVKLTAKAVAETTTTLPEPEPTTKPTTTILCEENVMHDAPEEPIWKETATTTKMETTTFHR
ncbi:MAG: InlB B-repeat-containing protein [Acutalibacteraceae bacterium]